MKVLSHHIYEFEKGLRSLVLHTIGAKFLHVAETRLQNRGIDYLIQKVNEKKFNVFFGAPECVEVIKSFGNKKLSEFSDEEDFILGIMLGYNRIGQCQRYIQRKEKEAMGAVQVS